MLIIVVPLITLAGIGFVMAGTLIKDLMSGKYQASLMYSFLLALYIVQFSGIDYSIFNKLKAYIASITASGVFEMSNHFVLSMNIISFSSALLLVLYHKLKLTQILPVK